MAEFTELKPRSSRGRRDKRGARREKLALPDGQRAFEAIISMENDIYDIKRAESILRSIVDGDLEEREQEAVSLIADVLGRAHRGLSAGYTKAFDATWGFVHGPNTERVTN